MALDAGSFGMIDKIVSGVQKGVTIGADISIQGEKLKIAYGELAELIRSNKQKVGLEKFLGEMQIAQKKRELDILEKKTGAETRQTNLDTQQKEYGFRQQIESDKKRDMMSKAFASGMLQMFNPAQNAPANPQSAAQVTGRQPLLRAV